MSEKVTITLKIVTIKLEKVTIILLNVTIKVYTVIKNPLESNIFYFLGTVTTRFTDRSFNIHRKNAPDQKVGGVSVCHHQTSMIIGRIIGRRFVFSYKNGARVSVISFLISDHCVVRRSMILLRCLEIRDCASLIRSPDSLI